MRTISVSIAICILTASLALANEGTGTAGFCERHGCGAPEDPGSVTECPNVTCPDVTCEATDCSKTTVVVNPTVCPPTPPAVVATTPVTFPNYYPCRRKADGTAICPRRKTPHRVLMPEGSEYTPKQ